MYDSNNIFAKILREELPCTKVYEDNSVLAFHDIKPKGPVHVLVIPKGPFISFIDFVANASEGEIANFYRTVARLSQDLEVENGFRLVANIGPDSGKEVDHFHVHIIGGARLGPMA